MPLLRRAIHATALILYALCASLAAAQQSTSQQSAATGGGETSVVRRATLIVHDLEASIRFYRDVLGFEVWLRNEGKVTAESLPSTAPRGSPSRFVIMKGKHPWIGMVGLLEYGGSQTPKSLRRELHPADVVMMIETDDVATVYRRMQAAGTPILRPPKTQEVVGAGGSRWQATFLFAWDPDGHLLEINQRGPLTVQPAATSTPSSIRREFFDGRYGQLHLRRGAPQRAFGTLTPVVLLHQTPLSGRMFSELLPELARDRLVLAPDTPGYGESAGPATAPALADYAAALHDLIAEQKEPVDLVGYHTGALIAAAIAERYPQSVRRLVLVSVPLFDAAQRARLRTETTISEDGSTLLAEWRSTMSVRPAGQSLEQAARIVAEKQRAGSRAGFAMAAIAAEDGAALLHRLRVPTVIVRPRDGLWENGAMAAALLPGTRLVDAPQWGYGFFDADPAGVARLLREILDAPAPQPAAAQGAL